MEGKFKVNKRLEITFDAKTQRDLFWELSDVTEVFGDEPCRICGNENTIFFVRRLKHDVKGDLEFPERKCTDPDCGARLMYSINKKGGTMYPVRKTADGKWDYKYGGWAKYDRANQPDAPMEHDEDDEDRNSSKKTGKGR